jgi:co-chaperonin GroES (HSP10)
MKFKPSPNKIIIKIKGQFNDVDEHGLKIDTTWNPEQHIRIEGEVVAVPHRYDSEYIGHKYPGSPQPKSHNPNNRVTAMYFYNHRYYTVADCNVDLKEGDKVYFHYLAIQFEDFDRYSASLLLTDEHGYEYHQIPTDTIIAVLRDGEIKPLLSRVLVQPLESEETDFFGVILPKSKEYLKGVVRYVGESIKGEEIDIKPWDKIMYLKNKEFENKIEGENYYVMRHWVVISKEVDGEYEPVGDYVKIELEPDKTLIKLGRTNPFHKHGKVISVGERCDKSFLNQSVSFNNRSSYFVSIDEKTIFVKQSDIYWINAD